MSGFIGVLVGIILVLLVVGLFYWAVTQLLPLIPLPAPFGQIIHVLLVVIMALVVIWIILVLLGAVGVHVPGPFRWTGILRESFTAIPA